MDAIQKLDIYIRSRYLLIAVCTHEEKRVLEKIKELAGRRNRKVVEWSIALGLKGVIGQSQEEGAEIKDPLAMLDYLLTVCNEPSETAYLFVIKDFHNMLTDPVTVRYVREIGFALETAPHTVIFLSPSFHVPNELEASIAVLDWPLPTYEELGEIVKDVEVGGAGKIRMELNVNGARDNITRALQGLTAYEAESCLLAAAAETGVLNNEAVRVIIREKSQIVRKSGVLEIIENQVTMLDVGGAEHLKPYARVKLNTYSKEAKAAGLDPARGLLLVGVPGTGKSLFAKAVAGDRTPLLRLDMGSIMGSLVGQSEGNMRTALKVAEAVAPAILWIDEVEKGLGGQSGGELDGGTTSRVFGTLLTWMQERRGDVYIIATANDITKLRPEFLRRFDDIFFVDLPGRVSREEIFRVHMSKRGKDTNLVTDDIITASRGYTGAEIEKAIKAAIEDAFFSKVPLTVQHLQQGIKQIVPIAQTMSEEIAKLRQWAVQRARPAGDTVEDEIYSTEPQGNRVAGFLGEIS